MTTATLLRGFERVAALLAAVAGGLILVMSLWITYDVLSRYLFDVASPWSFDLSEYSLVWITFLGAPWVLMQDRHVRIEILVDALPVPAQRALGVTMSIIAIGVCVVLAWRTGIAAVEYFRNDIMMPRIWRIPRIWPYAVVPIGSFLLACAFVVRLGLYLVDPDPESTLRARATAVSGR
ncbi:MAG: TRAP transporter small permease [Thiotrichales bacterium]|nr:TRAP transporter small permease [Thiotrichales bacterium]MCY4348967.1 TRAP transporter small permease [Thiotrichales bacterium]